MELVMETITKYQSYLKARKQVSEMKGFYTHFAFFLLVISVLIYLNLRYSPEVLWFTWTLVGWGIGVFFHAKKAFNCFSFLDKEWEEKKLKQFIEEENKNIKRNEYN